MGAEASGGPRATYRLQLGTDLDLRAAAALCDYLAALGVTHVYCSPVLQARTGSTHGYDVADPRRVSAELGGEPALLELAEAAHRTGLRLLVDFVPNHVGTGPDNPVWEQLLAEGLDGVGAGFFDVDWSPALPGVAGKVILPVLGAPYGEILASGELAVADGPDGPRVRYHEHSFPLAEASRTLFERSRAVLDAGGADARAALHELLEAQHYRLVHWRAGDELVNYRRFFAIDELAAIRVEEPAVFEHMHGKVLELLRGGVVDGLRLDHVDGLTDPTAYLERLRDAVGPRAWVVVEKILAPGESLAPWPVAGTTGYDFLADVLGLFVDPASEPALTRAADAFNAWPGGRVLAPEVHQAKREVLERDLAADSERLVDRFWAVTQAHVDVRDVARSACRSALLGVLAELDVYRLYTHPGTAATDEAASWAAAAVATARARAPEVPEFLWGFLEDFVCGRVAGGALHAETLRRFHQVASAAMAKGVEDTLLYRQHRLTALNEVGVEPEPFGADPDVFHASNARRAERDAGGLLATATHDTKRGEDVRLRVAALTELPARWETAVLAWKDRHAALKTVVEGVPLPDLATEYLTYQTLVGVWPPAGEPDLAALADRVEAYLVKATREAGVRTSWTDPDERYEAALAAFLHALLDPSRSAAFLDELAALTRRTGAIGMLSSLSQVLLRCTSPGAPDTYQGCELWDDSLVDPDNRRPVDFPARRRLLAALDRDPPPLAELVAGRADGRAKLWVLSRALRARRANPSCFGPGGGYEPLEVSGRHAARVVAFARSGADAAVAVTVAPRLAGPLIGDDGAPPLGSVWADTTVHLSPALAGRWTDALGGAGAEGGALDLSATLTELPLALLVREPGSAGG